MKNVFNKAKSNAIGSLIAALLFSFYITFQKVGMVFGSRLFLMYLLNFLICFLVVEALSLALPPLLSFLHIVKVEKYLYEEMSDKSFFFFVWRIMLIAWVPVYLAFFPGIFGYDTPNQLAQLEGMIPFSTHHPLFHTFFMGLFLKGSEALFHNFNVGIGVICVLQGLLATACLSESLLFMKRKKVSFPFFVIAFLWCLWNPVIQVLSFNTTKDILFGILFVQFALQLYDWMTECGKGQFIKLIVVGIVLCLMRNQGFYIVLALLVFALILRRKDKKGLIALLTIVVISKVLLIGVEVISGAQKGDSREMLSVPMQQMAAVCQAYLWDEDVTITQEQFDKFCEVVEQEHLMEYESYTADPIKTYFNTAALKSDFGGHIKNYLAVGAQNPRYFLEAFAEMTKPYWDDSLMLNRELVTTNTFTSITDEWDISRRSLIPKYEEILAGYITDELEVKNSVVSFLLNPSLCIWIFTAIFGLSIMKKNKDMAFLMLIPLLFLGTILLGPVALLRYLYPITMMTPWLLGILVHEVEGMHEGKKVPAGETEASE